jgi:hypothetical protein
MARGRGSDDLGAAVAAFTIVAATLERALSSTTAAGVPALAGGARVSVALPATSWPTVDALRTQELSGPSSNVLPVPSPRPAEVEQLRRRRR